MKWHDDIMISIYNNYAWHTYNIVGLIALCLKRDQKSFSNLLSTRKRDKRRFQVRAHASISAIQFEVYREFKRQNWLRAN